MNSSYCVYWDILVYLKSLNLVSIALLLGLSLVVVWSSARSGLSDINKH